MDFYFILGAQELYTIVPLKVWFYQDERVGMPLTDYAPPHCCTCLKPLPGFRTANVVVSFVFIK
jgi:hypothetical protein